MHSIICNKYGNLAAAVIMFMLFYPLVAAAEQVSKKDTFTGKDKLEHFAISAIITSTTGFVLHNHFKTNRDTAIAVGFSTSLSLGGIKELIDKKAPGEQSSWKDLIADLAGCAAGVLILAEATK